MPSAGDAGSMQAAGGRAGGSPSRMKGPEKGTLLLHQRQKALQHKTERAGSDPSLTTLPAHAKVKPMLMQSGRSSSDNTFRGIPQMPPSNTSSRRSSGEALYSLV